MEATDATLPIQVPRRLVGTYLEAKVGLICRRCWTRRRMRWSRGGLTSAPAKAKGLTTQAALLERRLKWAAQAECEAPLHDARPEKEGPMRALRSELQSTLDPAKCAT